jgi:DNA-binding HxlR family transcriptional regulator
MVTNAVKPGEKISRESDDGERGVPVARMVEDVVGCKWSLHVLAQIRSGVNRPGALAKTDPKLTTKVLNERLAKMVAFGILRKVSYPEVPPRVEYELTAFGRRFAGVLDSIEQLQRDLAHGHLADAGGD